VNQAVDAATRAFKEFTKRGIAARIAAIECVRKITNDHAAELG